MKDEKIPLSFFPPRLLIRPIFKITPLRRILRLHFTKSAWKLFEGGKLQFLLRVDDFPRCDMSFADFVKFYDIIRKLDIPFVLGVTPFLACSCYESRTFSAEEVSFLKHAVYDKISLSLHGFTHKKYEGRKVIGEIDGYKNEEIEFLVFQAKNLFDEYKISFPDSFIPPFNVINLESINILQKYFSVIFGGPLSLTTLGPFGVGEKIKNVIYLPSYEPFYGRCSYFLNELSKILTEREVIIPLTIHWAWETSDNFASLKVLLRQLKDRFVTYNYAKLWWMKRSGIK